MGQGGLPTKWAEGSTKLLRLGFADPPPLSGNVVNLGYERAPKSLPRARGRWPPQRPDEVFISFSIVTPLFKVDDIAFSGEAFGHTCQR